MRNPADAAKTDYQFIVIGAGAAGLAAAYTLQEAGQDVVVLEARHRIGGRVDTDYNFTSHPIERGAEFIQGENIITWDWIRRYKVDALRAFENDDNCFMYLNGEILRFSDLSNISDSEYFDYMNFDDSITYELAQEWVDAQKPDTNLAQLLEMSDVKLPPYLYSVVNHSFSADYAVDMHRLGTYGLVKASYEDDGDSYFRVKQGYSHLLESFGNGLNIRLSTPVTRIVWSHDGVRVLTQDGATFTARHVIITLPLALLQSDAVTFEPKLPDTKRIAINGLGCGQVTKVFLKFDKPFWSSDTEFVLTTCDSQFWMRPGWGRTDETAIFEAYIGGTGAEKLGAVGHDSLIQAAINDLEKMFSLKLSDKLVDSMLVNWQADPYARMAYSYVPVGGAGLRQELAQSVENVLFFAGEATNTIRPATVHGAIESGFRAAHEILKVI